MKDFVLIENAKDWLRGQIVDCKIKLATQKNTEEQINALQGKINECEISMEILTNRSFYRSGIVYRSNKVEKKYELQDLIWISKDTHMNFRDYYTGQCFYLLNNVRRDEQLLYVDSIIKELYREAITTFNKEESFDCSELNFNILLKREKSIKDLEHLQRSGLIGEYYLPQKRHIRNPYLIRGNPKLLRGDIHGGEIIENYSSTLPHVFIDNKPLKSVGVLKRKLHNDVGQFLYQHAKKLSDDKEIKRIEKEGLLSSNDSGAISLYYAIDYFYTLFCRNLPDSYSDLLNNPEFLVNCAALTAFQHTPGLSEKVRR